MAKMDDSEREIAKGILDRTRKEPFGRLKDAETGGARQKGESGSGALLRQRSERGVA